MAAKSIREVKDRDVVLCTLTDKRTGRLLMETFVERGIPFTQTWKKGSLFQRAFNRQKDEICTVRTHRSQYGQARRALDQLGSPFLNRIQIHVV